MTRITIEPLTHSQHDAAVRVLARAFATNPLHEAAFGASHVAANEAFFRQGLAVMKGPKVVAMDGSRVVGALHWVASPACQFSGIEQLRLVPAMVQAFGLRVALNVSGWLSAWSKRDLAEPHGHLGPIGVNPDAQGRRIGQQLMDHYCSELARAGLAGYLETDRAENVAFYARFGFEVVATMPVLGVTNHFMRRPPPRP